jgi:aryl carrier-like protein
MLHNQSRCAVLTNVALATENTNRRTDDRHSHGVMKGSQMSESVIHTPAAGAEPAIRDYLLRQWSQLLAKPELGLDDNFFEVGGDSFAAVRLTICLDGDGYLLNVYEVFEAPTIREQAALLAGRTVET